MGRVNPFLSTHLQKADLASDSHIPTSVRMASPHFPLWRKITLGIEPRTIDRARYAASHLMLAIQHGGKLDGAQVALDGEEKGTMPPTILLVDGDSANRTNWEALLQNHGYRVVSANNGNTALQECPRVQPDLVLMAGSLPGLSAFEVCRQLKSGPLTRSTPVVMMMPAAYSSEMEQGKEAGVDDFWGRPGSRWEALNRIQSILQLRSYIDLQAESVVISLARSLEAKHRGTEGHSERLVGHALRLGESLDLSG
jgi:CheY-like chemotaxis protein